jgi:putative ABC transport system substrate-binding protein
MRRREFVTLVGAAAASWPLAARAQQPVMPVIGFLGSTAADDFAPQVDGFRKGLAEAGYVEGRNVVIDFRWAENRYDRLPGLAAEFAARGVDVILASGPPAAVAAKAATKTIPVTFVVGFDPVAGGLVASLNRPGGNLTGVNIYIGGLVQKKLELLHEMASKVDYVDLVINPGTPSAKLDAEAMEAAGRNSGGPVVAVVNAGNDAEIDTVFAELGARRTAAVIIGTDTFYFAHRQHIAEMAARTGVPTIGFAREFVTVGGLMSYGANIPEIYRQAGISTARILKGEKPADMPVQQPTKFELVINLKTAKTLGLDVPLSILTRADEVIE